MKLNGIFRKNCYPLSVIGLLLTLTTSQAHAGTMGPVSLAAPGEIYASLFGGGGSFAKMNITQYGTAYYPDEQGGPLAVDAFGKTKRRSLGMIGGHVGYQWSEITTNPLAAWWSLSPAVELEGYYLGRNKFRGHDINNNTLRLPEHDFIVTYPTKTGVFLTNAVLNLNPHRFNRLHPYVSAGIGAAVVSISHATALQIAPPEFGINHYNTNPDDTTAAFAAQAKGGLNFDFSPHLSVFAEYRWLYLTTTRYSFGSTVYPGHFATSNWLVKLGSQHLNMGAVGIRFHV